MSRFSTIRNVVLSALLIAVSQFSFSMTIVRSGNTMMLSGTVEQGDLDRVSNAFKGVTQVLLANSGGGDLRTGLELGYLFRDNHVSTIIDGYCYSSCALMFLGGELRAMSKNAMIGFHGVVRQDHGFAGELNSVVVDYIITMAPNFNKDLVSNVVYELQGNDVFIVTASGSRIVEQGRARALSHTVSSLGIVS